MKALKSILGIAICIALFTTAVIAEASVSPGDLYEIYDTEPEKFSYLDNATLYGTADVITFDTLGLPYTRGVQGSCLDFDFQASGRSGRTGDYAVSMKANTDDAFGGVGDIGSGGWDMFYDEGIGIGYNATVGDTPSQNHPLVIEFDIKTDTNTDAYGIYIYPTWVEEGDACNIFGSDGKIAGTDYEYEANKWYHFKWEIDGKRAYVYITPEGGAEELIVNGAWSIRGVDNSWRGALFMQQSEKSSGDKRAGMTIDNWQHYSYIKSASGNIISPSGSTVSNDKDFIFRVTVEAEEDDEIELCVDDDVVASFDAEVSDGKTIHDYAVDIDHCTIENGTHLLTAYKISNGIREKAAQKIINVSGKYAGLLPMFMAYGDSDQEALFEQYKDVYLGTAQNTGYPIGVETFDEYEAHGEKSPYLFLAEDLRQGSPWPLTWADSEGVSGQEGDRAIWVSNTARGSNKTPEWGLSIIRTRQGTSMLSDGGLFEMEFDLKVATTTDAVSIYDMPLWHAEHTWADGDNKDFQFLLNNEGRISGTDEEYQADTWMHFKLTFDKSKNIWNVWKDLKHIVVDKSAVGQWHEPGYDWLMMSPIEIEDKSAEGSIRAQFWMDNLSVRQYFDTPAVTEVAYNTDNASDMVTPDLTVPVNSESVTLSLDKKLDAVTDANIELLINGDEKAVSGIVYDSVFNTVTVPLRDLQPDDSITLTIKDATVDGVDPGDIITRLKVRTGASYIVQTGLTDNTLKVHIFNGGDAVKGIYIFAAVYDEATNKMTDCQVLNTTVASGEKVYTILLSEAPEGKKVRVFAWNKPTDDGIHPFVLSADVQ